MNPQPTPMSAARRKALTILLAMTVLIVVMDVTILNVALESIQEGLDASNSGLQWSINSYAITFAAFIFTGGVCADRYGRKRTLIIALVIFGVASVFAAFSGSITELVVWRSIMGVGAAVVPTVTLAVIINDFPPAERAKGIAAWAATGGIALAAGPIVGGLLLSRFWWGSVFLINAPLVIASIALVVWLVPESASQRDSRFDPAGVLISVVASGALVYGIVTGGETDDWTSAGTLVPILGGLALIAVLIAVERRVAAPSLDVGLFRSARFSAGTVVIALAFFAFMGSIYITTFYFQAVRGYSPLKAGMLMLPMGIGAILTSTYTPRLMRRFGPRLVVTAGTLLIAVALVLFSQAGRDTALWWILVLQFAFGFGWGGIMAPATASLMSVVPPKKTGAGQAVSQTLRQIGAALGVAVIGGLAGAIYRSSFDSTGRLFPSDLRDEAAGSIGGTMGALNAVQERVRSLTPAAQGGDTAAADQLQVLNALRPPVIMDQAFTAYLSAMHVTLMVTAAVTLAAAFVAVRWLPDRLGPPPGAGGPGGPAPGAPAAAPGSPTAPGTSTTPGTPAAAPGAPAAKS